jgi:hypothetical protein
MLVPLRRWLSVPHMSRCGAGLSLLIALAVLLQLAAGVGLAYVAGFSQAAAALGNIRWVWLFALVGAEDHALLAAATQAGCPVVQAGDIPVETSGRRLARAPRGFSSLLRTLADRRGSHGNAPPGAIRPHPVR